MKCNVCKSEKIKTKQNYFFGKKSKARIQGHCKICRSTDIDYGKKK